MTQTPTPGQRPDDTPEQPELPTEPEALAEPELPTEPETPAEPEAPAAAFPHSSGQHPEYTTAGKPARNLIVTILLGGILLMLGIIIGLLIGGNDGDAGAGATSSPTTTAAATQEPTAAPTLTEEEEAEVLALIRAQPRRDPDDPYAVGDVDAPVVLVEYADYRCSYCAKWTLETRPELMPLVDDGTLRMEWRDFPVFQNESIDLAVAARAAAQQGLFWEYNEAIFRYQFVDGNQDFTAEALTALAEQVGVPDLATFAADMAGPTLRAEVEAEYEASLALLGQASTPQFLVNDQYIGGAAPLEDFQAAIQQELEKVEG